MICRASELKALFYVSSPYSRLQAHDQRLTHKHLETAGVPFFYILVAAGQRYGKACMFPSQISARLALAPHGCANAAAARRITQGHQELVILPTGHKPHMWNCVQLLLDMPGFHRINRAQSLARTGCSLEPCKVPYTTFLNLHRGPPAKCMRRVEDSCLSEMLVLEWVLEGCLSSVDVGKAVAQDPALLQGAGFSNFELKLRRESA